MGGGLLDDDDDDATRNLVSAISHIYGRGFMNDSKESWSDRCVCVCGSVVYGSWHGSRGSSDLCAYG
jgi:hypothetical protein